MPSPYIVHHLLAEKDDFLIDVVKQQTPLSHLEIDDLIYRGSVWSNFLRCRENVMVEKGHYVRVHAQPRRFPAAKIDWKATVIHEESDFIVVQKPAGIPVHPTVDNWVENVIFSLETDLGFPVYITQRLDTGTEGVLVLAKTKWFQGQFNKLLRERRLKKYYCALTQDPVSEGEYVHFMRDTPHAPKEVSLETFEGGMECRLVIQRCIRENDYYRVDVELLTGRTHQIRAQLSALGAPILGDKLYGSTSVNPWMPRRYEAPESVALRAQRVEFRHPSSQIEHVFECRSLDT
jgi:23S rRNA pseudouridine1911/1915/1917 synthase